MEKIDKIKWYYKPVPVVIAILCIGPFALPLLWFSPSFKRIYKIIISIVIIAISVWFVKVSADLYGILLEEFQEIEKILSQ